MQEILVINLMRLGDQVQSTPVLRRLKKQYPESRLTYLVMDLFQEPSALLPYVDRVLIFPSNSLAADLERVGWPEAAKQLLDWFEQHLTPAPHLAINLTPSIMAGILAFATGAAEVRGLAVNRNREVYTSPSWMSYTLMVSKARRANPFNLVDLFLRSAGLDPDGQGLELLVPLDAARQADELLSNLNLPPDTALIGLLPGASSDQRRWPTENFARAAHLLLAERPCHFFIFGSPGEQPLGTAIQQLLPPGAVSLYLGRTTLPVLTAFLQRLNLLITNDTGPMHLAAAVNTPVLALFLASARVHDTGPVGAGHISLEPRLECHPCFQFCSQPRCYQAVAPAAVAYWALQLLDRQPLYPQPAHTSWPDLRVYYASRDPLGYHTHLPLVQQPLDRRHFWLWLQRGVWGHLLDVPNSAQETLLPWLKNLWDRHYLPPLDDLGLTEGRQALQELLQLASQGEDLAQEILALSSHYATAPVRLWQKGQLLRGIDPQLRRLAVGFPELASFLEFFFQEQKANQDTDLTLLAQELAQAYRNLQHLGTICLHTIREMSASFPVIANNINDISYSAHFMHFKSPKPLLPPNFEGLSWM